MLSLIQTLAKTIVVMVTVPIVIGAYVTKPPISTFDVFCSTPKKPNTFIEHIGLSIINSGIQTCLPPRFYNLGVFRIATMSSGSNTEIYIGAFNKWIRLSK